MPGPKVSASAGAEAPVGDQEVGRVAGDVADLEDRRRLADEGGHVEDGAERHALDDAEGDHRRRVAVHDRDHVRPRPIHFAVDEALEIDGAAAGVERVAVEIVFDDVGRGDEAGRHVARQEKAVRVLVVADADMAERVEHALLEQDAVGDRQVLDQVGAGRSGRAAARVGHDLPRRSRRPPLRGFRCTFLASPGGALAAPSLSSPAASIAAVRRPVNSPA